MRFGLLGAIVSAAASMAASAQTAHHVAWSKVGTGSWSWSGIYTENGAGQPQVANIVAISDPSTLTGENLQVVWYIHGGSSWTSKSWTTTDPWKAINAIKAELSISDDEDENWGVCNSTATQESAVAQDYSNGVLATDPLAPLLASSPDSELLVGLLVEVGYPAASLSVDKDDECSTNQQLDGLASEFEGMVADGDENILNLGEAGINCQTMAGPPKGPRPTKPAKPTTAPPWTPPGTTPGAPTGPGWTPGGWPTTPGTPPPPAWKCRFVPLTGGGGNRTCSRTQRWGRWETTTCGCWPWTYPCIKWHEVWETETCTDLNVPFPPGGPPGSQANCTSTTQY